MELLGHVLSVVLISLALTHDEIVLVAFSVTGLEADYRRRLIGYATALAVTLRIIFPLGAGTAVAYRYGESISLFKAFERWHNLTASLFQIIGLTLAIGIMRLYRCWKAYRAISGGKGSVAESNVKDWKIAFASVTFSEFAAATEITFFVAIASQGYVLIFLAGVLMSLLMRAIAANFVAIVFERFRWLSWVGLLIILYVALDLIYRDSHHITCATYGTGCSETIFEGVRHRFGLDN